MDKKESLKKQIELAKEGYMLSKRYSKSNLPFHLRKQGVRQSKYYYKKLIEAMTELYSVKEK